MVQLAFHDISKGNTSSNGNFFDRLIQWRTGSPLVHVELAVTPGPSGDTMRPDCLSSLPGTGVRWTSSLDLTASWWHTVTIKAAPGTEADIVHAAAPYLKQRYDWLGIIGLQLPWGMHDDEDKFCSELVALVLQKSMGIFKGVDSWRVTPAGLYDMVMHLPVV